MKAIKIKKSVGKAYVFNFNIHNGHKNSYSNTDKTRTEIEHSYNTQIGYKCSEISEVELFETVEEQVPEVGLAWVFFYKTLIGNIEYVVSLNERDAKFRRNTCKNNGFECSAIREVKEEF
jgi:hypothetical protein